MLLGSKTISLEEFKIQYSVCFVWFAKLQPYKFESFYHRFDITMEHYSNIKHRLNIHMKQVAFKYWYLKVFWSRRLFGWNIIEDLSLLQEKKNILTIFFIRKKMQHNISILNSELTTTTTSMRYIWNKKKILTDLIFKMVPIPIVVLEWKKNKENNYSKILYLTCVLSSCQNTVRFRLASFIVDKTGSALKLAQNQYILVTS